jgi:cytochrome c-type biogenesis protein CcmH/NrfF
MAVLILVLASSVAAAAATAASPSVALSPPQQREAQAIGNQVNCMCGCLTTLNQCPHPIWECSMKATEQQSIATDIQAGKPQRAIIQDLVLQYGVKVLPTPPAKGFNLIAWILPGVGLIVGLVVAIEIARRWRRPLPASAADDVPVDPKILAAIEEEMKKAAE